VGAERIGENNSAVRYLSVVDCRPVFNIINFILYVVNPQMLLRDTFIRVDVHESVHRDIIMKVTNRLQLYRLIYYS
jgi:hypothetical protein